MSDATQKKPIYKKWWFWVLVVFILIIAAAGCSGGSTPENNSIDANNANQEAQNPPAEEATWQEVKTWTGNGAKKTEPFTITGKQWRINWTNSGGYMGVSVYKPGSSLPQDLLVNTTEATSDVSYIYKNGEFYLDVNATGGWEITVEELK